ncbi:MAG TPA: hypothetical protein VHI76_05440 [Solirubrobacterales bacterium]|jgi:hypothetical protein|nr:hypothetical protein [Solirubrobacterales bacterium]
MPDRGTTVSPLSGWLLIVGGVALALVTFLPWYEVAGAELNAWEGLRRTDVVIFGAGVVTALCGAWLLFGNVGPEGRVVAAIGAGVAAIGAVVVIVRMVSPPGDADLRIGIFIALVAAAAGVVGGLMALATAAPTSPRRSE